MSVSLSASVNVGDLLQKQKEQGQQNPSFQHGNFSCTMRKSEDMQMVADTVDKDITTMGLSSHENEMQKLDRKENASAVLKDLRKRSIELRKSSKLHEKQVNKQLIALKDTLGDPEKMTTQRVYKVVKKLDHAYLDNIQKGNKAFAEKIDEIRRPFKARLDKLIAVSMTNMSTGIRV